MNSSVGDRWGLGAAYRGLSVILQAQGEHSQAVDMFRKSLDTFTELGGNWWVARVLAEMGKSMLALGNDLEAIRVWREALRIATEINGMPVALEALVGLASLQAKRGHVQPALVLLLIVSNHPAGGQEIRNRAAHLRANLEAQLARLQIEAAQTQAQAKSFEAVVDDALKETGFN